MSGRRCPHRARALALALAALAWAVLPGCGPGDNTADEPLGTVHLLNQSDQGMAPLVIDEFYLAPVGETSPGPNLLPQPVQPGGQVTVGLFPPGMYNGVAVLDGGSQINFPPMQVVDGQPTNYVVP